MTMLYSKKSFPLLSTFMASRRVWNADRRMGIIVASIWRLRTCKTITPTFAPGLHANTQCSSIARPPVLAFLDQVLGTAIKRSRRECGRRYGSCSGVWRMNGSIVPGIWVSW